MSSPPFSLHPLEPKFVGAKPIESAEAGVLDRLESEGRLIIQRKRDGNAMYVSAVGSRKRHVGLYSRVINELTAHFPALTEELREINLPADTLFAAEALIQKNGVDNPDEFGKFARSHPARAVNLQQEHPPIQLVLFNTIVRKGTSVVEKSYEHRLDMLRECFAKHTSRNVHIVEVLDTPLAAAQTRSLKEKWEGLVLYDKRASSAYRLDGKADQTPRPDGCWKWKQYSESDFVVTGWVPSTAKSHLGMVKDLKIAQYDPIARNLVDWGKVGTGLTREQRKEFTDNTLYPMVVEVVFVGRTPKNRLKHAHIKRMRYDKKPEECFSPPPSDQLQ